MFALKPFEFQTKHHPYAYVARQVGLVRLMSEHPGLTKIEALEWEFSKAFQWCWEQFGTNTFLAKDWHVDRDNRRLYFTNEAYALAFKLRWC
ncbi:MAG: hypothetical protein EOP83_01885 [Verrucomicrobiaceae bacterium]|nr:MAG: hypothetical protein EOP83_01885 [Verrucomicrobiaceae bacterium]